MQQWSARILQGCFSVCVLIIFRVTLFFFLLSSMSFTFSYMKFFLLKYLFLIFYIHEYILSNNTFIWFKIHKVYTKGNNTKAKLLISLPSFWKQIHCFHCHHSMVRSQRGATSWPELLLWSKVLIGAVAHVSNPSTLGG